MKNTECDVLVIGGGITGVAAAVAAARNGSKTVLIESRTFVGGNGTVGYCFHNYISKNGQQMVFGLAQEIVDKLVQMGGAVGHVPYGGFVHSVTPVDGEMFRILSTQLLAEAGVTVLYGAIAVGVEVDGGYIKGVKIALKGSVETIRAKTYIDASGDADVAISAGAQYEKGDDVSGKMQPVSILLRFYGTDNKAIAEAVGAKKLALAKRSDYPEQIPVYFDGNFSKWNDLVLEQGIFPNKDHKVFVNTVWPNQLNVNTAAIMGVDGTDPVALSKATSESVQQVYKISKFLKEYVPGFKDAYFSPASFAGVRETRRIVGLYKISDDDAINGQKFEDTIGRVCFPVDIHDPVTGQASFHDIGDDGSFDIPFRALIPQGLENLLVAGRCISTTTYVLGATRNHAPCLVMGQSAGIAASIAAQKGVSMPELDIKALQENLKENGVYLG